MDKKSKQFVVFSLTNSIVILAGLTAYIFIWNWIAIHADLAWLQQFEVWFVYSVQRAFGVPVDMTSPITLQYYLPAPGFGVEIIALCTGVGEILFFAFLVLLFRGVGWRAKAKGLAVFLPVIFIENLLRLIFIYPLAVWFGVEAMWDTHWFMWKYGTFAVLMLLFSLWYMLIARKELKSVLRR
jgi:exosortase/archaeosortase family protein